MSNLDQYPPMYQLQQNQTKQKQLQIWSIKKKSYLLDINVFLQTPIFQSTDCKYKASKELQYEIIKYLIHINQAFFVDDKRQSLYLFDFNNSSQILQLIKSKASDDILTITDFQNLLAKTQYENIPINLLVIILNKLEQTQQLTLIRQNGKVDGVKLK